jgi:multidrug efflux pump subunit AcrB
MNLIKGALQKPVTIIVAVIAILFFSFIAIRKMRIDTFPQLGLPTVYVAQPYGGLSPEQMEGYITSYYEYHFLYITGVKFVESKSIQGAAIIKIQFQEGTEMSQALAEVVGYVNRAKAFMPPGTVPPFITRFDAGSVPVGQLVFTSQTRSLGEISDLALFRVRPMFATLPGVSAPPPFGGNQKTVIVMVNPEKVRDYNLSPDDIVQALAKANNISPSGNVRIGDEALITSQNTVVENVKELEDVPVRSVSGIAIYIRDIGSVSIGSDVTTSFALVNGKRTVYIPVTKRADASTWDVVKRVKSALPDMQAAIPDDIKVTYEFDQSGYVINSLKSLVFEGGLGVLLTGLMVLLFLRDKRSALIVVLSIPLSLLTGITILFLANQTINIMTLGGLALSVGILVDMATVIIENIHQHLEKGNSKAWAILDGCTEVAGPLFLILLSILAVFTPALFMSGVPKGMFLPLSLSVGFALIASFVLSLTFVPVVANWLLKPEPGISKETVQNRFDKFRYRYKESLERRMKKSASLTWFYLLVSIALLVTLFSIIGTEIFPKVDAGQAQVRLRMPVGTRIERTETATQKLLVLADSISRGKIEITSAFIGTQPSSYPINTVYLWTSGPQESVIKINLKNHSGIPIEKFKEQLRDQIKKAIPEAIISFEPGDLVEQVLNLGSNNPIEIAIIGRNFQQTRTISENLNRHLKTISFLRDVQVSSPLDYPSIKIDIDRVKAGKLGLTVDQISKSIVAATSSSRFTQPNYWLDKNTGTAYQIQVEYPQYRLNSSEEMGIIPVGTNDGYPVYLRDVAALKRILVPGEYDRINMQRFLTITANIHNKDLGSAVKEVRRTIASLGSLPQGVKILVRGQADLLTQTMSELQSGLVIAIVVIFLMLAVSFQSFRLSFSVLSILPAVISGSVLLLLITGKTLNIQSYMGMIMAVGVAVANAVLFITNAEINRKRDPASDFSVTGAFNRIRPILMTSFAMIAGMIPMSLGLGEGGEQTAPLAISVIGGLMFSTISTLLFLPIVYIRLIGKKAYINPSLDPEDENSKYYVKEDN